MTQKEAIQAMKEGHNVRHKTFMPHEYIHMLSPEGGTIITEEGYCMFEGDFWLYRKSEIFQNDWDIVPHKTKDDE